MKLFFLTLPVILISQSSQINPWPEYFWLASWDIGRWKQAEEEYHTFPYKAVSMPVFDWFPEVTKELETVVDSMMKTGVSMEWIVDSLETDTGLADDYYKQILYYQCMNYLVGLEMPWRFENYWPDLVIHGGAGNRRQGWVRYAWLMFGEDPFYEGFFAISWIPSSGESLNLQNAVEICGNAKEEGVFVSRSINPVWDETFSVEECSLYNNPAYFCRASLEFDCLFWDGRIPETYNIFIIDSGEYTYLVGFTNWLLKSPAGEDTVPPDMSFYTNWIEKYLAVDVD